MTDGVIRTLTDKEQVVPMIEKVQANPAGLNNPEKLLADTGYFSEMNVVACWKAGIEPLIAVKRDEHHPDWRERFTEATPLADNATPVETMKHALKALFLLKVTYGVFSYILIRSSLFA